ncbi:MAG: hypothetical protein WC730_03990 [Patescibacteria group bacterium]|jgi:hypothetical protein
MSDLTIKAAELTSQSEQPSSVLKTTLLPLSSGNGWIFGITRILGKPDERRERIAGIIHEGLQKLKENMVETGNPARRFEQTLQEINEDIGRFMEGNIPMSLTEFHSIIGIVSGHQMYLSGSGKLMTLFMHMTGKKRYVIYELDQQFEPAEDRSWKKVFLTVLDGEMNEGDLFYAATRIPAREIPLRDLQDILVTLPPAGALKRIQQHVSFGENFGGVTFNVTDTAIVGPPKKENPIASLEHLGETEEQTTTILGEESLNIRESVKKMAAPILKIFPSSRAGTTKSTLLSIIQTLLKFLIILLVLVFTFLKKIFKGVLFLLKSVWNILRDKERKAAMRDGIKNVRTKILFMPKRTKYIVIGAFMTLCLLIGGSSVLHSRTQQKKAQETFDIVAMRVEEKIDEAEARLIYDDKEQASTLLAEATTLLSTLSQKTTEQQNTKSELESSIQSVLDSIRQTMTVSPTILGEITAIDATKQFSVATEAQNVMYGITAQGNLYRLNELTLQFEEIVTTNGSIGVPVIATGIGSNILFVDPLRNLGKIDTMTNTANPITSGTGNLQSVDALTLYNDNLYALDSSGEQIVKMRPQGDGYDGGTNWIITKNSSLTNARDLSIDGDVYVLTDSDVIKFSSGQETEFNLQTLEPALKNPREIWTTVGTDYFYILDAGESRVIVFKKDGTLVTQYSAPELAEAIAFSVRETDKVILFSTATAMYSFQATHLIQ